jgi:hypothetical protein
MFARMLPLLSLCLALGGSLDAQQHRSTVRGTVWSADGTPAASIPMRMIHEQTGETRRFMSDAEGRFTLVQVEPGSYRIESEDDRYSEFIARARVRLNTENILILPLALGSISQTVDYRTFVVDIDQYSPSLRTSLPGDFLTQLPFDGRRLLDTILLAPRLSGHPAGPEAEGTLLTNYWIDGFVNSASFASTPSIHSTLESVQEVQTAVPFLDAAWAGGGAQVNVLTRSGTNTTAGGAFGFVQTAWDRQQFGGFAGGPVAQDRTFLFADVEHTGFSGDFPLHARGTDGSVRFDHLVTESSRLTARYAVSDGMFLDRRAHTFGTSFRHTVNDGSNDIRFSVSRLDDEARAGLPTATTYIVADTFAWTLGEHALDAGGEWRRADFESVGERPGQTFSAFIQDNWRATHALSLHGGVRLDRLNPAPDLGESETQVLPRLGVAWQPFDDSPTVLRGGYGRFAEPAAIHALLPAIDQWSIGAARQVGRTRTIEVGYEGARQPDVGRLNALVFEMEQRSEVGLTGHLTYRLGAVDLDDQVSDVADDPQHKVTGAFTWWLPFGDERPLFSEGLLQDVFGEMQLTGVFVMENVRTDPLTGGRGDFKTLDLGLLKNLRIVDRTLQLRFETFNTLNRPNARPFSYLDLVNVPFPGTQGRRYQLGARFLF